MAIGCAGAMGIGMGYTFGTMAKRWLELAPARAELQSLTDRAEEQGDNEAAHALGIRYSTAGRGDVVSQDIAKAMAYYEQAAAAGHSGAHCRLGAAHRSGLAAAAAEGPNDNGNGNGVDMARAKHHFEVAAAAGHAEAQFNLAVIYEHEDSDSSDSRSSDRSKGAVLNLYRSAAAAGFAPAQFQLGLCYFHGRLGLQIDHGQAAILWAAASEAGDDRASYNLAMLHLKGDVGVTGAVRRSSSTDADNKLRGRELLERAARQGNSRAPAQLQVLQAQEDGASANRIRPVECEHGINDMH